MPSLPCCPCPAGLTHLCGDAVSVVGEAVLHGHARNGGALLQQALAVLQVDQAAIYATLNDVATSQSAMEKDRVIGYGYIKKNLNPSSPSMSF